MIDTTGSKSVERLAQCGLGPLLGGAEVVLLSFLKNNPGCEAMEIVDFPCTQGCGTVLQGPRFWSKVTACDPCRAKAEKESKLEGAKTKWEALCPTTYRETDKTHAGFPLAQYNATKTWAGGESLFFYGPTGKGKTRLAMLLLKRCLVRFNIGVGVLWPYELQSVKNERDVKAWVKVWGGAGVLLMDDPLQGAPDARVTDALKLLIAYRIEWKRTTIVTSQIGGDDYAEQAGKFGKDTKADKETIKALLRRLRESYRVVSFAEAVAAQGEAEF